MASAKIRVGILGANPDRGWAATAHIPALKHITDYELVAVATSQAETAQRAAEAYNVSLAFTDHECLVTHPDVDLVVVSVKAPMHHLLASSALRAGKHVYCEWPLGRTLAEAEDLAALAAKSGTCAVVGLQARVNPDVLQLRELVSGGFVGRVLSSSVIASGGAWGAETEAANAYTNDREMGATMLRIPMGHFFEGLTAALGDFYEVSALTAIARPEAVIAGTGARIAKTAPDQVVIAGMLGDPGQSVTAAIHYRAGSCAGTNFLWEINGTEGDIVVRGQTGHLQFAALNIWGARRGDSLKEIPTDDKYRWAPAAIPAGPAYNVGQAYVWLSDDIRNGTRRVATFADGLRLHRQIDAIETAARTGVRQLLDLT